MFIKNILKNFDENTKVVWLTDGKKVDGLETVKDVMANGLLTYIEANEPLTIKDNAIIIKW